MRSTYSRETERGYRQSPVYEDADQIPLQRDIEHRRRAVPFAYSQPEGTQSYDTSTLGLLALAAGAGALLTWFGTASRSQGQGSRARSDGRYSQNLARDETDELIASNKVEGTAVYDMNGEKIGSVENFMVGKRSGRVAYAVISFGGFLGLGGGYHAVPWNALTYSEKQGGYVVPADKKRLKNAPTYQQGEDPFLNPAYGRQVSDYWLFVQ